MIRVTHIRVVNVLSAQFLSVKRGRERERERERALGEEL
jgi:hypothetical protein